MELNEALNISKSLHDFNDAVLTLLSDAKMLRQTEEEYYREIHSLSNKYFKFGGIRCNNQCNNQCEE